MHNINLTTLTIFRCIVQEYQVYAHCCATITTINLYKSSHLAALKLHP